jgi:hypothetical protein
MRLAFALVLLAACHGGAAVMVSPPGPACTQGVRGQILAEAIAVDASDEGVYWEDYNGGTIQRQARAGGPIETLVTWPGEHLSEGMRVGIGAVYWTSKAEGAVYRRALPDGAPEKILETDRMPQALVVVRDTVYAATDDGGLLWWRNASEQGVVEISDGELALATDGDVLYVGSDRKIQRLASSGAGPQDVEEVGAPVDALAAAGDDRLYWREGDRVMRRIRGEVSQITTAPEWYTRLAAVPGGVLIGGSDLVWFAADDQDGATPVGVARASITDLVVRGPSVFVGTDLGTAEELCVDPAQPVPLTTAADCPGSSCEWYASGALAEVSDMGDGGTGLMKSFYSDGTLAGSYEDDTNGTSYFFDGTEAIGAPWAGTP